MMHEQLPLGIRLRDEATFDNFLVADNRALLHSLTSLSESYLYLYGASGTGKTHLLQAACHQAGHAGLPVVYLPLAEKGLAPAMLDGLENMALVALDDIQHVMGQADWEQSLFNLYNRIRDKANRLLVSSALPLAELPLQLADLQSRLSWGPVFRLQALQDDDKQRALQLRARNRGLELTDEVANYLLKHSPRDMHSLFELFEKLDHASMVEKRKLTIPFIRDYL